MASSSPGLGTDAAGPSGALHLCPVPRPHLPPVYDLRCAGQPGMVPHLTRATLLLPDQDLDSRVMVPASLALAAYLAGLDDVCGTWPLLHLPSADWHALLNLIVWRVLPRPKLAACKEDPSTAWQLLVHRDAEYKPRDGCLLPSTGKSLGREAREARLPRPRLELCGTEAAQQEQLRVQREADRAFWLASANCDQTADKRWQVYFLIRQGEARRAAAAARFSVGPQELASAGDHVHVHRLVCWWLAPCESVGPEEVPRLDALFATPVPSSPASAGGTWPGVRLRRCPSSSKCGPSSGPSSAAKKASMQPTASGAARQPCSSWS